MKNLAEFSEAKREELYRDAGTGKPASSLAEAFGISREQIGWELLAYRLEKPTRDVARDVERDGWGSEKMDVLAQERELGIAMYDRAVELAQAKYLAEPTSGNLGALNNALERRRELIAQRERLLRRSY